MRTPHHPAREDIKLAAVFHALSDPIRLRIVQRLAQGEDQGKEMHCAALYATALKSTMSHHFKVLRECGVIRMRPEAASYKNSLRREDLDARFPGLLDVVLTACEEM